MAIAGNWGDEPSAKLRCVNAFRCHIGNDVVVIKCCALSGKHMCGEVFKFFSIHRRIVTRQLNYFAPACIFLLTDNPLGGIIQPSQLDEIET